MFHPARPVRGPTAQRRGPNYATVFNGKNISDKGRLSGVNSLKSFEGLWKGAVSKPSTKIVGLPFIWEESGVVYRSSSLAFDKNMWISSTAHNHWNAAIGDGVDKKTAIIRHIRPALSGLNHLLSDNGLGQDLSRPADESLLPPSARRERLETLRKALTALAWSYSADTAVINKPLDDIGAQSVFFRWKHKAAEIGREAKPILREAWSDSRDIEAGDKYARLTKQRYEANPNQARCLSAHEAFASTSKHIGMGVTTLTRVNKSELVEGQKQCLSDLKLVIGLTDQKIKEVVKKNKPRPIKSILDGAIHEEDSDAGKDFDWLGDSDFAGDSVSAISLA